MSGNYMFCIFLGGLSKSLNHCILLLSFFLMHLNLTLLGADKGRSCSAGDGKAVLH